MSTLRELIRKYEPVLRFGTDADGRPERFFPMSARDYVHSCGLRRRKVGWLQQPGDTFLFQLGRLSRADNCYLVFAAVDLRDDSGLSPSVVLEMVDSGLELARSPTGDALALEGLATGFEVTPRLLLDAEQAAGIEANLSPLTAVERRPLEPAELSAWLRAEYGLEEQLADAPAHVDAFESATAGVAAANLEWVQFPALAPLPVAIRNRALEKYEPYRDWRKHPPVYHYHVTADRGYKVLQYWFLYAYNDWASHGGHNDHEGDWEVIFVFLDEHDRAHHVAYSRHVTIPLLYGPSTAPWTAVEKVDGTHPVVYVGCGSHASYLERGVHRFFLYRDRAMGDHLAIGAGDDQAWGEAVALSRKRWNSYFTGAWGALVKSWLGKVLPNTEGPTGPAQKGDKWQHPAQWAGIAPIETPVRL